MKYKDYPVSAMLFAIPRRDRHAHDPCRERRAVVWGMLFLWALLLATSVPAKAQEIGLRGDPRVSVVPKWFGTAYELSGVPVSPDGRLLAMGRSDSISVVSLETGYVLARFSTSDGELITSATFLDNLTIAISFRHKEVPSGSSTKEQRIFDLPSQALIYDGPEFIGQVVPSTLTDDFPGFLSWRKTGDFNLDTEVIRHNDTTYQPLETYVLKSTQAPVFYHETGEDRPPRMVVKKIGEEGDVLDGLALEALEPLGWSTYLHDAIVAVLPDTGKVVTVGSDSRAGGREPQENGKRQVADRLLVRDLKTGTPLRQFDETEINAWSIGVRKVPVVLEGRYLVMDGPLIMSAKNSEIPTALSNNILVYDTQLDETTVHPLPVEISHIGALPDRRLLIVHESGALVLDLKDMSLRDVVEHTETSEEFFLSFVSPDVLSFLNRGKDAATGKRSAPPLFLDLATMTTTSTLPDGAIEGGEYFAEEDGGLYWAQRIRGVGDVFAASDYTTPPVVRRLDGDTQAEQVDIRSVRMMRWFGYHNEYTISTDSSRILAFDGEGRLCVFDGETCWSFSEGRLGELHRLNAGETYNDWDWRSGSMETIAPSFDGNFAVLTSNPDRLSFETYDMLGNLLSSRAVPSLERYAGHYVQLRALLPDERVVVLPSMRNAFFAVHGLNDSAEDEPTLVKTSGPVRNIVVSPDWRLLVSINGSDNTDLFKRDVSQSMMDFFDTETLTLRATLYMRSPQEWLMITPEGFYAGPEGGNIPLRAALGVGGVYPFDQLRASLYRPELVVEALRGDPDGVVSEAAEEIDLRKILFSGDAPDVSFLAVQDGANVDVTGKVIDTGGGIGRIEWRVNGALVDETVGETAPAATLPLAAGANRIELIAHNGADTIPAISDSQTVEVAASEVAPPRLVILSVGVDAYEMEKLRLKYAVNDAKVIASAFADAGQLLYDEVIVETLLDGDVTREKLDATFMRLRRSLRPNDVFVFFLAGHGKTLGGKFYFIPADFQGRNIGDVRKNGISHDTWRQWFARLPVQKSLLLFDSCESGTLTDIQPNRDLRFRTASDLLGNDIGRALLTASTETGYALEGFRDHGVFAFAIQEALVQADGNGDELIDVDEIAEFLSWRVPEIAEMAFGEQQIPQYARPQQRFDVVRPIIR